MKSAGIPRSIIVMGKIGSGKSSVMNSLTQTEHFKVGDSGKCETREVQMFCGKFKKRFNSPDILFIDTPGFIDNASTSKIASEINTSVNKLNGRVDLVLFCFPSYEIRLNLSMKISCRFLKAAMDNPVYQRIIIVLTHGNRLSGYELESAVAKMTTEFIPYLKTTLKCSVCEEILIYRKGEDDGLDEVMRYVEGGVDKELVESLSGQEKVVEYLVKTSQSVAMLKEMLLNEQARSNEMESQLKQIREGTERKVKDAVKEAVQKVESKLKDERSYMELFKESVSRQLRLLQCQAAEKDKEIGSLRKELEADRKILQTLNQHHVSEQNRKNNSELNNVESKENRANEYAKEYGKIPDNNSSKYANESRSWRYADYAKTIGYCSKESAPRRNHDSRTQIVSSQTVSNCILMPREINVNVPEQPVRARAEPGSSYKYGTQSVGVKRTLTQSRSQAPVRRIEYPCQRSTKDLCTNYYRYKINLNN
eukprot:TRINITY_DN12473_c0_g1_i17.p1 TRINITY_DN12473_c0_g1~~TRINITY_DN12473_c0_g1_i17.p1  ORF type:complete len:480 (+),score=125.82 TRINITY_DN12473_c0_g1_i17:71-1510(+)